MALKRTVASLLVGLAVVALGGCGGSTAFAPAPEYPELRLGMSIVEAKEELGSQFKLPNWLGSVSTDCNTFALENAEISGLVISKRIATVSFDLEYGEDGPVAGTGLPTLRGLRASEPIEQAIELFGRPDLITPSEYVGEILYWRLGELDGDRVYLRTDVWDSDPGLPPGSISSLEVGVEPAIFAMEGCA